MAKGKKDPIKAVPETRRGFELVSQLPEEAGYCHDSMVWRDHMIFACENGVWSYSLCEAGWRKIEF